MSTSEKTSDGTSKSIQNRNNGHNDLQDVWGDDEEVIMMKSKPFPETCGETHEEMLVKFEDVNYAI